MALFGGSWTNQNPDSHGNHLNSQVGWCTVPHKGNSPDQGAEVYVFFEHGDINCPVYFAAVQAGDGWFSEHDNQHVFRSDNVHIRIDQNTADPKSTCKFSPYVQRNSVVSIKDMKAKKAQRGMPDKNIQTRIDIQIAAQKMVAINLQISGDVNIRQFGDMYIEQQGDRHQTLIGDRYVKHVGHTYIEHEGNYISRQEGDHQECISGTCLYDTFGSTTIKTYGDEYKEVQGDLKVEVKNSYTLYTGRDCNFSTTENFFTNIIGNFNLNIGKTTDIDIGKNCYMDIGLRGQSNGGLLEIKAVNNVDIASVQGNIVLRTLGQFELLNSQKCITSEGYKNIGTKGNISLISNMGNIDIETVGNKDFEKTDVVIPWNPVFLGNLQIISQIIKDFDPQTVLFTRKDFNFQDISEVLDFIINLPLTVIYDGLPTILPCKMITQNPNINPVREDEWKDNLAAYTPGEYRNFTSVDDDWRTISNTAYWKVIGRLVGNINIKSWSGDIDILTEGRLGNAGNINIQAQDSIGTLPDYKAGNLNISNKAESKIYNDPRHYFFDSQNIFSRNKILSNGDSAVPGKLFRYIDVKNKLNTAGGCASCISEYLFYIMGTVAPLPKTVLQLLSFNIPFHTHNPLTKIPNEDWDSAIIQTGYDHAYDNGMIDDFNTINHGVMTISSDGPLHISAEKDYTLDTNKAYGSDSYSFSVGVTPNWQYGEINFDYKIYLPLKRHGINMGNTLTYSQSFGNKYSKTFTQKKTNQIMYGTEIFTNLPNISTDKELINYAYTIGKYCSVVNENYNPQWIYVPSMIKYFDPNFVLSDPLGIPIPDIDFALPNIMTIIDEQIKGIKKTLKANGVTLSKQITDKIVDGVTNSVKDAATQIFGSDASKLVGDPLNSLMDGSVLDALNNIDMSTLATDVASNLTKSITNSVKNAITSVVSLILGAPICIPLPAYTETHNKENKYTVNESIVSKTFNQYLTKNMFNGITIINDFHQMKNKWNIHAEQQISVAGVPVAHFVEKNLGLKGISNIVEFKNGNTITENFNATTSISETRNAVILNNQNFNSLAYSKNVNASTEVESYTGTRSISDNLVTWAVAQLNFVQ